MGRGGVLMGISPLQRFPANDAFPDRQSQMRGYRNLKHGGEFHRQDAKGDELFASRLPISGISTGVHYGNDIDAVWLYGINRNSKPFCRSE